MLRGRPKSPKTKLKSKPRNLWNVSSEPSLRHADSEMVTLLRVPLMYTPKQFGFPLAPLHEVRLWDPLVQGGILTTRLGPASASKLARPGPYPHYPFDFMMGGAGAHHRQGSRKSLPPRLGMMQNLQSTAVQWAMPGGVRLQTAPTHSYLGGPEIDGRQATPHRAAPTALPSSHKWHQSWENTYPWVGGAVSWGTTNHPTRS